MDDKNTMQDLLNEYEKEIKKMMGKGSLEDFDIETGKKVKEFTELLASRAKNTIEENDKSKKKQ